MVFRASGPGQEVRLYASRDGGSTWADHLFPERTDTRTGDPQVGFGPDGTAYALMLGGGNFATLFYRSLDGGRSWERIRKVPELGDYEQMTVDQTTNRFRGRVYIVSSEVDQRGLWAGLTISSDGGQTFSELSRLPAPTGKKMIKPLRPVVLADGTLMVFGLAWDPETSTRPSTRTVYTVVSRDGGTRFSEPAAVLDFPWGEFVTAGTGNRLVGGGMTGADIAIANGPRLDRGERLCVTWVNPGPKGQRVTARCSDDGGKTWGEPIVVAPATAGWQHQVMVAINPRGVVGVAWLDTRDDPEGERYHLYFTASSDGAQTFLPARRVTSAASVPSGPGNRTLWQNFTRRTDRGAELHLISAAARWPTGGDYAALLVDANGAFRPFWPDARSGSFQVYTARVQVLPGTEAADFLREPAGLTERRVDREVAVECEPLEPTGPDGEVQLRVRNVSSERLYGPIRVAVSATGGWEVLEGADLTPSLADLPFLPPGGATERVRLRLRAGTRATHLPVLTLTTTARATPPPQKDGN
jgi:hypothetical protein